MPRAEMRSIGLGFSLKYLTNGLEAAEKGLGREGGLGICIVSAPYLLL